MFNLYGDRNRIRDPGILLQDGGWDAQDAGYNLPKVREVGYPKFQTDLDKSKQGLLIEQK